LPVLAFRRLFSTIVSITTMNPPLVRGHAQSDNKKHRQTRGVYIDDLSAERKYSNNLVQ
jgi:hypothetical protein